MKRSCYEEDLDEKIDLMKRSCYETTEIFS